MTEDKFNGDYDKLREAYTSLESKLGQQSTQINDLTTQVEKSQETIQSLQSAQTKQNTDQGSGGSLYDWANGQMRGEDGSIDKNLLSSLQKVGATQDQVEAIVGTIETAQTIVQEQTNAAITSRFGNKENFDAATMWAKDNLEPSKVSAINTLLSDRATAAHGMEMLKNEASAGGLTFEQKKTEPVDEPSTLPDSTGSGGGGVSPLRPNTPEAMEAMNEAFASGDPAKVKEYEERLRAGQRASQ